MAFEFKLPDIGEGVVEGEIVSWKVAVGDRIEVDQPLVEVMTDKATVEISSPQAGTIARIDFGEGDICPVGAVMVVIKRDGHDGAAAPSVSASEPAAEPAPAPAAPTPATPAPSASTPPAPATPAETATPRVNDASADRERVKATPATRRLARELGVNLAAVPATGKSGRTTSNDVRLFARRGPGTAAASARTQLDEPTLVNLQPPDPVAATGTAGPAFAPIAIAADGEEERVPLRGLRKRIADNMSRSTLTAAHFTYVEEIDMTELVTLRNRAKASAAERGLKLTYLPFIIKAVVSSLKKWPQLNAALDETTQEVVRKKYYHVGIASQGPHGLMVTVLRDADRRSLFGLAAEIQRLADAVQAGKVTREELSGSTFTITSLGKLGGVMATPIINFPEVGILGVHEMKERPAVRDGEIVIRWLMNLSISLDHRLVDGWDGAMFLQDVKRLLEDPTTMFMEMV
ncbi:dihydrolipoamide acetyltransferase family protein [Haliangium sp.]|uniref:dihydrolipoamide acetyltransferase family protein n=1 Tax=Haliangium sp. TaxID=2663208 RepID=UPI003D0D58F5